MSTKPALPEEVDIPLAWKDESYRAGLSSEQRNLVPPNPAGTVEASTFFWSDLSDTAQSCYSNYCT
jgi:mersacidin/lichenicidin family type 2 lantibiotic